MIDDEKMRQYAVIAKVFLAAASDIEFLRLHAQECEVIRNDAIACRKAAETHAAELEVRAEAAEAKVATLLKVVEEYEVMARLLMSELSAQAKRLAELEEAPTGLEWQPVRNAPPEGCVEMRVWPTYDPYDNEYQFGYETVRVANIMRAKGQWRPVAAEEEGD